MDERLVDLDLAEVEPRVVITKPHKWEPSRLGHGESMCVYCYGTNREIAVIGDMNHCPKAPQ